MVIKKIQSQPRRKRFPNVFAGLTYIILAISLFGCVSVPPQIAKTHQKELEIIQALRSAHLAMVDSYIDQKLQNFENFFFDDYGPVFLNHWITDFKTLNNRDYDADKDFPVLYNDLVAEYQAESEPIEKARSQLRQAIEREHVAFIPELIDFRLSEDLGHISPPRDGALIRSCS